MAGNYMNAPAHRLAYDLDGSLVEFFTASNLITQMTGTQIAQLNSETEVSSQTPWATAWGIAFLFPIPTDMTALFVVMSNQMSGLYVQTSKNTTNGVDGTWTTQTDVFSSQTQTKPNYRQQSSLITLPAGSANQGLRGLRIVYQTTPTQALWYPKVIHLYGEPSANATTNRLSFWHPTSDAPLSPSYFDFGNTARGSTGDLNFRIKNLSSSLTANSIQVYTDAPTPGTPSVASMLTFSTDNKASFSPSFTIASLAPGAVSPVYTVRRVTPSNAQISVWSARIDTEPQSWS